MALALRTEGLTKRFGAVTAVDGLDIRVEQGSVFGFLGPNGAGKTTTIHLLLGLVEPTSGRAEVLGHDVARHSAAVRAEAGVLLEHHGLYERMTAEDNLELYARIWGIPAFDRPALLRGMLERFGLWERRRDRLGKWSKGMKTRLALARALIHRPSLLFLDEPTAGLDPASAAEVREDLVRLARQEGVTIFLTTHNLHEAEKICDNVAVIHRGRLRAHGPPQVLGAARGEQLEVVGQALSVKVRRAVVAVAGVTECVRADDGSRLVVHLEEGTAAAPVVAAVVGAGGEVEEVRRVRQSLEDVFLGLVHDDAERGAP